MGGTLKGDWAKERHFLVEDFNLARTGQKQQPSSKQPFTLNEKRMLIGWHVVNVLPGQCTS